MFDPKTKKLAQTMFEALQEIKGKEVVGLNFEDVPSYADLILIASASNIRQVQSLADNIQKRIFEACQLHPLGVEGYENAQWVLVDYGDVVCHIFFEETRQVYHLEDMWPKVDPISEADLEFLLLGRIAKAKPVKTISPKVAKPKAAKSKTAKVVKPAQPKKAVVVKTKKVTPKNKKVTPVKKVAAKTKPKKVVKSKPKKVVKKVAVKKVKAKVKPKKTAKKIKAAKGKSKKKRILIRSENKF